MALRIQIHHPEIPEAEVRELRMAALLAESLGQQPDTVDCIDDFDICGVCLKSLADSDEYAHADSFIREVYAHLASCICDSCWDEYNDRLEKLLPPEQTN